MVKPLALPKVELFANTLLDMPSGGSWQSIQTHAISKNITNSEITLTRLEPSLMRAADREYIYQCARGTYRHLNFLELDNLTVKNVLAKVKSKLQALKYEGRDTASLAIDIFKNEDFSSDYFVIRHIVRAFGASEGIFFKGKSGADTVSLDSDFDVASQKTILIEVFKKSLKALSKKDIADKIRSQSIGHANFYLDKLVTEGVVVRVDETHYAHIDNAFKAVDISQVIETAIKYIEKEDRVIEGEKIQAFLNRNLGLEFNKYFYLSMLKVHASDYGANYYFVQNLLSKEPLHVSGLVDYCRDALAHTSNTKETIEYIKEYVCAHEHVIRRALHQSSLAEVKETDDTLINTTPSISSQKVTQTFKESSSSNLESSRVLIGRSLDSAENIYWEYGNKGLANRHMIVFGRSGQGKTYCIQGLLMELAKVNINSLVVDYTNGFLPEHLDPEFIQAVTPKTDLIAHKPLDLNPFKKQKKVIAGIELSDKSHDVATRIATVFNSVFTSIGEQQLPTLIRVIEEGLSLYGKDYTFKKMLNDLEEHDQTGVKLANKLTPIIKANIFSCNEDSNGWESIFTERESVCRLIQMATLARDVWRSATEFILWDLYSYACLFGSKEKPLPVVLDEVQNLDHRLDSPLAKMLTEGRKYGLSLILATQTLSNLKKDEQDRLFQAAHKLFFAPAETETDSYAKLLEQAVPGSNRKKWSDVLANLRKGECISVGLHINEFGKVEQGAKTVKVTSLGERL